MNQQINPKQHILKVSELTKKVRFILESELQTVWLCGEISNFMAASSGHWYLSLKDGKSQVRCAMFKGNNRYVRIKPDNGQQVLCKAKVSLYEPRGEFQLIIEQMEDAGEGLLRQRFEQLKAELQMEGLFENRYKQALPEFVSNLGIVTSATGAAVKDILSVLKRRNPGINVIIYPTLVQGNSASEQIADAIYKANERDECDVLIVGRGGGSLEDLWSFNEEVVVRAIFDCDIPVISAVGHEVDTSLSDYVADLRAPTPSAAAELVSKDNQQLATQLHNYRQRLFHLIKHALHLNANRCQQLQHKLALTHPQQQLQKQQQRCDGLHARLQQTFLNKYQQSQNTYNLLKHGLNSINLAKNITTEHHKLNELDKRLQRATLQLKDKKHTLLAKLAHNLHIISPLATIGRGYSITRDEQGNIIRETEQLTLGQTITSQVNDGQVVSVVKDLTKD